MTKYMRQLKSARKQIESKGTTVVWCKAGMPVDAGDTTPEFSELGPGAKYNTPAVFYPASSTAQQTNAYDPTFGVAGEITLCLIPGDVPFVPEQGDAVRLSDGDVRHVDTINRTAPDGTPIVYEVSFH